MFTSDVKDRWAAGWIKWRGYGPFFAAVVHAVERQRPRLLGLDAVPGSVEGGKRPVSVSLEARDANGGYRDLLRPSVTVVAGGSSVEVPLRQVAPGRYEASVLADASQTVTVTASDASGTAISRVLPVDAAAEYRFRPPDAELLKSLASATGGSWMPAVSALRLRQTDRHSERRPLWPASPSAHSAWVSSICCCARHAYRAARREQNATRTNGPQMHTEKHRYMRRAPLTPQRRLQ